uniref:Uncharacterized protein n=1 Tax=viral metagenome TaxID=1070528 RepID=A0A6H1ZSL7_9ZZZZ
MAKKYENFEGRKIGRLNILKLSHRTNKQIVWECLCKCGKKCFVSSGNLRKNHTRSCGCLYKEIIKNGANKTHGMSDTRFNKIYRGIKFRSKQSFKGNIYLINTKCLWGSFEEFKKDMYKNYLEHVEKYGEKQTTIDRINNDGHYCKKNCRWATILIQNMNKHNAFLITYKNKIKNLSEWSKIMNIKSGIIRDRILRGWNTSDALTIKPKLGQKIYKK